MGVILFWELITLSYHFENFANGGSLRAKVNASQAFQIFNIIFFDQKMKRAHVLTLLFISISGPAGF